MITFGITPGKEIGIIKNAIREAILEGIIPNHFEEAYEYMLLEGGKLGLNPVTRLSASISDSVEPSI
jgi:hypothetical protein